MEERLSFEEPPDEPKIYAEILNTQSAINFQTVLDRTSAWLPSYYWDAASAMVRVGSNTDEVVSHLERKKAEFEKSGPDDEERFLPVTITQHIARIKAAGGDPQQALRDIRGIHNNTLSIVNPHKDIAQAKQRLRQDPQIAFQKAIEVANSPSPFDRNGHPDRFTRIIDVAWAQTEVGVDPSNTLILLEEEFRLLERHIDSLGEDKSYLLRQHKDGEAEKLARLYIDLSQFTKADSFIDRISDQFSYMRDEVREFLAIKQASVGDERCLKTVEKLRSSKDYAEIPGFTSEMYARLAYGIATKKESPDKFVIMAAITHQETDSLDKQARMYGFLGRMYAVQGKDPRGMFHMAADAILKIEQPVPQAEEWLTLAQLVHTSGLDAGKIYERALQSNTNIALKAKEPHDLDIFLDQLISYEDILRSAIQDGYFGLAEGMIDNAQTVTADPEEWSVSFITQLAEAQAHKANSILKEAA